MERIIECNRKRREQTQEINNQYESLVKLNKNSNGFQKITKDLLHIVEAQNTVETHDIYIRCSSPINDIKSYFKSNVSNNTFKGTVLFDHVSKNTKKKLSLDAACRNNVLIENCVINTSSAIYNNTKLNNVYIDAYVEVIDNGIIECTSPFEKDCMTITVGAESNGGRDVTVFPESTLIQVCQALHCYTELSSDYIVDWQPCERKCVILEAFSKVLNCHALFNSHLCPHSTLISCTFLSNSILLDYSTITHTTASLSNLYLQWNAQITSSTAIESSLLMEQAHVGPNSSISSSILGPDAHVSNGEIHNSLLGPNAAAHHQSLLISVINPGGRINIGYGSNIGSNHTSRAPDQECWVSEGVFFGLSCSIKFPSTFQNSYSIIATSVVVHPYQNYTWPFSLILSESLIIPAWVIQYSPYMLERNEIKYATRIKAQKHLFYTNYPIMRRTLVQSCLLARNQVTNNTNLSKKVKKNAIHYYTEFIMRFALKNLFHKVHELHQTTNKTTTTNPFIINTSTDLSFFQEQEQHHQQTHFNSNVLQIPFPPHHHPNNDWAFALQILQQEQITKPTTIYKLLQYYLKLEQQYVERVIQSKLKDQVRGKQVTPLWEFGHDNVLTKDKVVLHCQEQLTKTKLIWKDLCHSWGQNQALSKL